MESMPLEVVEKVSQFLTASDLATCNGVCHSWREIFNEGCLWKRHCNPSLEEALEKTPAVVEPRFVPPEEVTPTLTPISRWRLAFLREQHLWKNWRKGNHKKEDVLVFGEIGRDFLSDVLLVRWFSRGIEIWDVTTIPLTLFASTYVEDLRFCIVYKTNRLLVKDKNSLKILHVDHSKRYDIEVVHEIFVDSHMRRSHYRGNPVNCISKTMYLCVNTGRLSFDVIDLEKGMKIKTENCPAMKEKPNATIVGVKSSPKSDCVIVLVEVPGEKYHCYIYSPGKLTFFSGPVTKHYDDCVDCFGINGDFLAVSNFRSFRIFNYVTSALLFMSSGYKFYEYPYAFYDGFLCKVTSKKSRAIKLGRLSLTSRSWKTVSLTPNNRVALIKDKFIKCTGWNYVVVWEASGQTLKRSEILAIRGEKINESFTRGISTMDKCVYYYW